MESYPQKMEALRLLYEATTAGKIVWVPGEPEPCDRFIGPFGQKTYEIRFCYQERTTTGSDRDIVEVSFGGILFMFFNGTEGFDLANDMLALNIADRESWLQRCQDRIEENILELKANLEEGA